MRLKTILLAVAALAISFVVALKAMDWFVPGGAVKTPVLTELPPLTPAPRTSRVIAPITIPLGVIRDAAERGAPRNFAGKADNPAPQLLQNADINWTVARGPIAATGAQDTLSMTTPLTGTLTVNGALSAGVQGAIGDALSGLLGGNVAKQIGSINIKNVNANAEIRGNVLMAARPQLATNWRIDPNLTAQVNLGDTSLSISGIRFNVPAQVKPTIDRAVNDQLAGLQQRIRNDPGFEQNARREWAKLCRSIPLQANAGIPPLWLELRPIRAVAAQPRVDANAVMLTVGMEAETRVTSAQTTPSCPFPATLDIVPASPGKISVGVPIDFPFTELAKLLNAELAGKKFPEDGQGAVGVTVKKADVAASGDRLLISLLVNAAETKSWFGFSGDATVHIWGKPALDQAQQIMRLTDIELAVESEAAFGLLGAASRAAIPYLKQALAERATIDLKPFAADAQKRVAGMVADLQKNDTGAKVAADITSIRLAGIAFDSKTLRVIAEADGNINVTISALPNL